MKAWLSLSGRTRAKVGQSPGRERALEMREGIVSYFGARLFRLFQNPKGLGDLAQQVQDLRATLFSATQDIAVLRELLEAKGQWDEALYKQLRTERMIRDHDSAGVSPWFSYSYFPYTLEEDEFLRHRLRASEPEVKDFQERVDRIQTLT